MSLKFSIIIPTRHRPTFVRESLKYIALQTYTNFEVIVCDNYTDPALSCKAYFDEANILNSKYVRPQSPVGMVENWNLALEHATGDYVLYLTDKMFLLPQTLTRTANALSMSKADVVSWVDDKFTPLDSNLYFNSGFYLESKSQVPDDEEYIGFDPLEELSEKGKSELSRGQQTASSYTRGKICFGCYNIDLINRIKSKYNQVFYNISPDYTSMILALSEANSAIELKQAGIVHINTNLSNGGLVAINDSFALGYLNSLKSTNDLTEKMLVKGLYSSQHNMVSHDYLLLKNKFNLKFQFSEINWMKHIYEDLYLKPRIWSSIFKEHEQKGYFIDYLKRLPTESRNKLNHLIDNLTNANLEIQQNISEKQENTVKSNFLKKLAKFIIPYGIVSTYINKVREKSSIPLSNTSSLQEAINSIYKH